MAERRMFAKTIIDSDAFIDMPVTARLLYYDLGMRADDDGFVNSPKKIMRMVGASQDDLAILITKKFIIPFDTGVVVIKHWRIHNYIQKDRYKHTKYEEEMKQLTVKENGAYTLDTECIQDGYSLDTQVRLGKDRDRLDKERIDYQQIADMYNETCVSFPKVKFISNKRAKAIKARLNTYSTDDFKTLFEKAEASDFLKGKNGRNWSATFDWLIADANMAKVLDGNYDNRADSPKQGNVVIPMPDYMQKQKEEMQRRREGTEEPVDPEFAWLDKYK